MGKEIDHAREFARDLAATYGDALESVVLYGSAARGEYRPGVSDLNLLVLLRDTGPATLRRGSELARRWVAEGNKPPLILSGEEFRDSADVFPIELSDIGDAHVVLHGEDPYHDITIDPEHLRHQCESELKGKHIQLRERYLLHAGAPGELEQLLLKSFPTFLVLFRTVLRLSGGDGSREPEAVVRQTARQVGFDPEPMLQVHRARAGGAKLDAGADAPVVTGYLDAVEKVVRYVDRFGRAEA